MRYTFKLLLSKAHRRTMLLALTGKKSRLSRANDNREIAKWERIFRRLKANFQLIEVTGRHIIVESAGAMLRVLGKIQDEFRSVSWRNQVSGTL